MADLSNTTVLPRVREAFDKALLDRLLPQLVHDVGADKRPLSMRSGNQIKFRRFESHSAATTPLTEGVTPSGTTLDDTQLTSTIYQLGDYVTITDVAEGTDESPLIAEAIELAGEQAGDSVDRSIRDVINAGTYFLRVDGDGTYSSANARTTIDHIISDDVLNAAIRQLESYNVKKVKGKIKHSSGYGSSAIADSYIAIVHPHVAYDLRINVGSSGGFIPVQDYASYTDLLPGEIGAMENGIRFVSTTNAKIWTASGGTGTTYRDSTSSGDYDVYSTLVFGRGFYAMTELDGGIRTIYHPKGHGDDPLEQRSTVAWIVDMVPTILNDYCGVRIESCASL